MVGRELLRMSWYTLILRRLAAPAVLVVAALGFVPAAALAIGPAAQTISPTYDSVVRVLINANLSGGQGFMEGTGSVVANTNVNGSGYLWVLTADHVVSSTGMYQG